MEQVQMDYWDIEKVNDFNFLYKEVEKFMSRRRQSLVNFKSPVYMKQKPLNIVYGIGRLYILFFIAAW